MTKYNVNVTRRIVDTIYVEAAGKAEAAWIAREKFSNITKVTSVEETKPGSEGWLSRHLTRKEIS